MSYSASQFEDITHAIHRKSGKKTPKDQVELLEKDGSWIHQLKKRPHGVVNVPDHVLSTVTAAHEARVRLAASKPANQVAKEANSDTEEPAPSQGTSTSSPERFLSHWSQSPERRGQMPESSLVEETPHPQHARAAHQGVPLHWKTVGVAMPMSSLEEEEEMEVQLPRGENEQQEDADVGSHQSLYRYPRHRLQHDAAQVTNTPPCAQPDHEVIPATVMAEVTKGDPGDQQPRPIRRMKPITFDDDSPIKPKGDALGTRGNRMQSLKNLEVAETQETVVSSSIVPATLTQTQTQNASNPTDETRQDASEEMVRLSSPAAVAKEMQTSPELMSAKSHLSEEDEHMEDSTDATLSPLCEFNAAYPDYSLSHNGDQLSFVKACLCLEYLRNERALRDYLYDDFIRLFSFKYLDYVNDAGPDQEPLSAIEWFNMQSGQPLYNRQVINNDNIGYVLAFYGTDVASIRGLVVQHEQEALSEPVAPKTRELGLVSAPLPEEVQDSMELDVPRTEVAESIVVREELSAQDTVREIRPISQPASPAHTLVERRVFSAPKPPVSAAKSTPNSQAASPQLGSRVFSAVAPSPMSSNTPASVERRRISAPRQGLPGAKSTPSSHAASPRPDSRVFSAAPPSSMRSNAPVGTQYMQQLSSRQASGGREDSAEQRRERMRAAMRKRASASGRSSSSKAGSVV